MENQGYRETADLPWRGNHQGNMVKVYPKGILVDDCMCIDHCETAGNLSLHTGNSQCGKYEACSIGLDRERRWHYSI